MPAEPPSDSGEAARSAAPRTSAYLTSELGALWAFLRSKHEPSADRIPSHQPHDPEATMPQANATPPRAELEAELAERAWTDDAFRAELEADPTAVVRRELAARGLTLPDGVTVQLHEETPETVHLVLPVNPDTLDLALDDQALDLVAGGASGSSLVENSNPMECS